eukprot:305164-Alexandrium_andersonii.AAC.1
MPGLPARAHYRPAFPDLGATRLRAGQMRAQGGEGRLRLETGGQFPPPAGRPEGSPQPRLG